MYEKFTQKGSQWWNVLQDHQSILLDFIAYDQCIWNDFKHYTINEEFYLMPLDLDAQKVQEWVHFKSLCYLT